MASSPAVAAAQPSPRDPANRRERAARLRATGQRFLAAGDPGSAAGYFRDAVAVDPQDAEAYEALGRIYLARGAVGQALEVFSSGLRRRPDAAPLWRAIADALVASGDLEDAAEALRQLVERAPDDPEAHRARGELARRRGAWSEALASSRAILDLAARRIAVAPEALEEARLLEPALTRLAGGVDPARGTVRCTAREARSASPIRRALAGCAPSTR
jgi:tetratricopeptide (TPR) repeat protein